MTELNAFESLEALPDEAPAAIVRSGPDRFAVSLWAARGPDLILPSFPAALPPPAMRGGAGTPREIPGWNLVGGAPVHSVPGLVRPGFL